MGSKRAMLKNGLGELLKDEIDTARRFVDLFAGSGAVAIHIARQFALPVIAFDLQQYSVVLTRAVVCRQKGVRWPDTWKAWHRRAKTYMGKSKIPASEKLTHRIVEDFREWCGAEADSPITRAYGGHYFSPRQAVWIDALRATLPQRDPTRTIALAALIQAASQCVAAPGHTAQPFQPTRTAKKFLQEAWEKDIVERTKQFFISTAALFAMKIGNAEIANANMAAKRLRENDFVFIDPPYSGVHYSRFYHVLETIAHGDCGEVTGVGRYPASSLRPRSQYSLKTTSTDALDRLLKTISSRGAKAVLTFPDHECSNGLSGDAVRDIASQHFRVKRRTVSSKFSTLGGTSDDRGNEAGRAARQHANELMLVLAPK